MYGCVMYCRRSEIFQVYTAAKRLTGFDRKAVNFSFLRDCIIVDLEYNKDEGGMLVIYTLDEIKKRVFPIIQKYSIPAMYLFGSYARGEATEESDLDFLVDTTGTNLTSLFALGALYCELEEVFHKKIDLITVRSVMQNVLTESDRSFRDAVIRERVKLNDVA